MTRNNRDKDVEALPRWSAAALDARPRLDGLPYGRRGPALVAVAGELGISAQVLRRALAVEHFIGDLVAAGTTDAGLLRRMPLDAVDTIRRWFGYDAVGAREAIRSLLLGTTVEETARREFEARRRAGPKGTGQAMVYGYRSHVAQLVARFLPGWTAVLTRRSTAAGSLADFQLVSDGRSRGTAGGSIAVVTLGPFSDARFYSRNWQDAVLKGLGVSVLLGPTLMLIPNREAAEKARNRLKQHGSAPAGFHLALVEWTDEADGDQADLRDEARDLSHWVESLSGKRATRPQKRSVHGSDPLG